MDSEVLKDLLVHSDFNNLTCHQHKEIFGNQSRYWGCRPEDPEFYDCHPEILWKDINEDENCITPLCVENNDLAI